MNQSSHAHAWGLATALPRGVHQQALRFSLKAILTCFTFLFSLATIGISQINDDGASHTVNYNGTYQDFLIPNNIAISEISFTMVGGDGGAAEVNDQIPIIGTDVSERSSGGQGATTTIRLSVGATGIPHGSTVRFIVGGRGATGVSSGVLGVGFSYGGGGGGSAVLYKAPGSSTWVLLGVAGGGGGAYQGMFAYTGVDNENGQGGRDGTTGGSGNGDLDPGSGGTGGQGGDGNELGGAGGGAFSPGGGVTCVGVTLDLDLYATVAGEGGPGDNDGDFAGGYGGDSDGCLSFTWRNGGYGFGGGGAGGGAGGGGGGYSGGGTGGTTGRGGGGGSYSNNLPYRLSYNITQGGSDNSPDNGNISYQVFLNQPPVAICQNLTVYLDAAGAATITASQINNGSYDPDGSISSYAVSPESFDCSNLGANNVVLTVTDNQGSTATCNATVTVIDAIDPTVVTQAATIYLDANGMATLTVADVNDGSSDNCSITSLILSRTSFHCSDVGANTVYLIATDQSGHTGVASATVTVVDDIPPTVLTKDVTIYLDENGQVTLTVEDVNNGSTDNCGDCGIASLTLDITEFDCDDVGPNTVTLTAIDANGNTASATATVTVVDNIPPTVLTKDATIYLDANGMATLTVADVNDGSFDNCGIATLVLDKTSFDCSNVGPNTVTLTATDVNGNVASNTATVTVVDNIPPTIVSVTASPNTLWSPNHKMENVVVSIDSYDNCAGHTCEIIGVSSSEPLNDLGDGNTDLDYIITGTNTVQLRAERSGKGVGRIYTITVRCTDASGNTTDAQVIVSVSHDQSLTTSTSTTVTTEEEEPVDLVLQVNNNPSHTGEPFILLLTSTDKQTPIVIRSIAQNGRIVELRNNLHDSQTLQLGHTYKSGLYVFEAIQGPKRVTVKVLKQ